jgi:hypothetical protein
VSEIPIETDDPCDVIDVNTLDGWTRSYDSDGMRKKNTRQGLGGDSGDRYIDSWARYDRC